YFLLELVCYKLYAKRYTLDLSLILMKPYNDYNSYLRAKYGCKVYRIGLDAGFSCPNRDLTKGTQGCVYCNIAGSRASYANPNDPVAKQLRDRIDYLKKIKTSGKFIAYFQAFTNTYAPADKLKTIYDVILPFKEVIGLSIGTRPDAIDRRKMRLISSYKDSYEVWIEYGLQSIHDRTLKLINRGHGFKEFLDAFNITKEFGVSVCAHIILGLPGESRDDMMATAARLSEMKIDGIKLHLLHILKGSILEKWYCDGKVKPLKQDEYVELVCDFLENLSRDIIIQRLTGQGSRIDHIAPSWALDKTGTIRRIGEELERRGSRQGAKVKTGQTSFSSLFSV
ncbi:MAG: TIGR01212 family radical SAM protein, partial [Candidatus Omnitrophota bacterium]|nr:TIGR01212 family radical SAM protein [Candidatus Omnitrophota bacterium]